MNDTIMQEILERVRNRFYGKYRGTVTEVDASTMRIKAKVLSILGPQPTGWCTACVPYAGNKVGIAFLPEIGSGVWIEFEGGDVSYPIWSGFYWHNDKYPEDATDKVKVIITPSGHKILLDDNASTVTITDSSENKVTLESSGITLERGGKKITISSSEVNINDGSLEVM